MDIGYNAVATAEEQHRFIYKTQQIISIMFFCEYRPGVTMQSIPPAGLYPGLKRPRLDYTLVYYDLGQFIRRGILWPRSMHTPLG